MRSRRLRTTMLVLTGVLTLGMSACSSGGGDPTVASPPAADVQPDVTVMGTDALKFEPGDLTASAGTVAIQLTSGAGVNHNLVIEEAGDTTVVEAGKGQSQVGTIDLEPGTYTFYCSVPGHRSAGMEGTLTVS